MLIIIILCLKSGKYLNFYPYHTYQRKIPWMVGWLKMWEVLLEPKWILFLH